MDISIIFQFLKELAANNNREWFAASRNRYEHVLETRSALVARLIGAVAQVDPRSQLPSSAQSTGARLPSVTRRIIPTVYSLGSIFRR